MSESVKDYAGAKLGMWIFLFTEIVLFGGLFLLYASYLHRYQGDFHQAAKALDTFLGGLNTVILLTSSLCMALSITALQRGRQGACLVYLALTVALALGFLVNKFFEWSAKFEHGIIPGSAHVHELPRGQEVFFGLYFAMTGLHGIHVILGAGLLATVMFMVRRGRVNAGDFVILENSGLYWHVVDLIWIFLFPLFYLIT
ncbi:MAG: cytochrome c oxidase subunit 3 family protein [Pseudomonadota bacterium]